MPLNLITVIQPPLLTADIPALGGRIKAAPEDFEVDEIPAYEPCGSGDFLFLWLEKRGMGAEFFARQVAQRLGIANGEVGTAGLKDRHAVTRQWVSVPASAEPYICRLEGEGIRLLRAARHTNKLRAGHLRGNRFQVVIRDIARDVDTQAIVDAFVKRIGDNGLPNFYGPQRFGKGGETLAQGLALLHDQPPPLLADGRRANLRSPFLRKLVLSAVQSALFNQYLAGRMTDGQLRRVLPGDVMAKWPFGGMFVAEDLAAEQARFDSREIVSAGPIFGKKTFPAKHEAADREAAMLKEAGLTRDSFARFGKLLMGSRRHNLIYLEHLEVHVVMPQDTPGLSPDAPLGDQCSQLQCLQLRFALPAGSYATVLLGELMKVPVAGEEGVTQD